MKTLRTRVSLIEDNGITPLFPIGVSKVWWRSGNGTRQPQCGTGQTHPVEFLKAEKDGQHKQTPSLPGDRVILNTIDDLNRSFFKRRF